MSIDSLMGKQGDPSKVISSSIDAQSVARQYIRTGYFIRSSIEIPRERFSEAAVNALIKLLAGSTATEPISSHPVTPPRASPRTDHNSSSQVD